MICQNLLGHCYYLDLPCVLYAVKNLSISFQFRANLADSNALQGTSIGSTLPFAVVCAPSARKKSEKRILRNAMGGSDSEIYLASSLQLNFGIFTLT